MSEILVMKMTPEGLAATLSYEHSGLDITIKKVIMNGLEFPVVNGYVDTENKVLRFIAFGRSDQKVQVNEVKLYDENDVIFAEVTKESGYFFVTEENTFFSLNFSVAIDQKLDGSKIKLAFNREEVIFLALIQLHLLHKNPHPQYKIFILDLIRKHLSAANPHKQYALLVNVDATFLDIRNYIQKIIDLFLSLFPKNMYAGLVDINNQSTVVPEGFKGDLNQHNFPIFITPESNHESFDLVRSDKSFDLNVYNRSGVERIGYAGNVGWVVLNNDEEKLLQRLLIPELVTSGVIDCQDTFDISIPEDAGTNINLCAVIISPEGSHEGFSIARSSSKITVTIWNRSGGDRVGYSGLVSYAVLKPNNGVQVNSFQFPVILMSGISDIENGTPFLVERPKSKTWDLTSDNYVLLVSPEAEHEAWEITRAEKQMSINVWQRSGTERVPYDGEVSWVLLQKHGENKLYRAGTYEIVIPANSIADVHLVGAGGSGAGSLWASDIDGAWLKMKSGGNTRFNIGTSVEIIAGGGDGGYRGVWNNGSAYIQGVAGAGGASIISKVGNAVILEQKNGNDAYLETAHDWCNRDTRGGLTSYKYGAGGEGGYTVETRKHRCYGAGGGSGAHVHFQYANSSDKPIKAKLIVGNHSAPDTITPELNNGKIGEAGCATVRISQL